MAGKQPVESGAAEEAPKRPLMKLIIIGVVALVLVGGGGFFGYMKFFKKAEEPHGGEAPHGAGPAPQAKQPVEQVVLMDWEPFLVNLADPGGKRYLKVVMKMELSNPAMMEELKTRNFELRDAILMLLSGKEFDDIATPAGKKSLKHEIISQLNRVAKQGQVKEVYFIEFIVQ